MKCAAWIENGNLRAVWDRRTKSVTPFLADGSYWDSWDHYMDHVEPGWEKRMRDDEARKASERRNYGGSDGAD